MKKPPRLSAAAIRPRKVRARSLQRRLEQHLLSCSALAVLGTGGAQAAVHYSGEVDLIVPLNNNTGLSVDFDTGGFAVGPMTLAGYDLNLFEQAGTQLLSSRTPAGNGGVLGFTSGAYTYTRNLAPNTTVGPSGAFLAGSNILGAVDSTGNHGQFVGVTGAFIGFRFVSSSFGNQTLYGWARLNVTSDLHATLVDYAFEDNGGAILTGAVPEPSSLALGCLAAGATGLAVWRQRRRQQTQKNL